MIHDFLFSRSRRPKPDNLAVPQDDIRLPSGNIASDATASVSRIRSFLSKNYSPVLNFPEFDKMAWAARLPYRSVTLSDPLVRLKALCGTAGRNFKTPCYPLKVPEPIFGSEELWENACAFRRRSKGCSDPTVVWGAAARLSLPQVIDGGYRPATVAAALEGG